MSVNTFNEQQMGLFAECLAILRDAGLADHTALAVEGHRMLDGILYVHEDFVTPVLESYVQRANVLHAAMQAVRGQSGPPGVEMDTFIADGAQSQFTLSNRYPKAVISISVNNIEQAKAISGASEDDGYRVLIDFPNHAIVFPHDLYKGAIVKVAYTLAVD